METGQHIYAVITVDLTTPEGVDPKLALAEELIKATTGIIKNEALGSGTTGPASWSISIQQGELLK